VISDIFLNGVSLDLENVEYQVQIQHGRSDITSSPQPSNAQIIIRGPVGVNAEISDVLRIQAYGFDRFTGRVSDVTITHLSSEPPVAVSTITGIGELSRVGFVEVGATGWPHESVRQRVEDVLTTVGIPFLNGADPDVQLHQVTGSDIQPTNALTYLSQIAEWAGATYFDNPSGNIVFESYGERGITSFSGTWAGTLGTWAVQTLQWDQFGIILPPTIIPPETVIFTPTWSRTRQSIINSVTVLGYNETHETTQTDSASIAVYDLREYRLNTELRYSTDVIDRAGNIITAQANPLWSLGAISILVHNLDETTRDLVLSLVSGMAVSLSDLPQPAPVANYLGLVEGWGEVYVPGEHILTLSLSDPRYSFQTITWGEVDPALIWGDVPADLQWFQVLNDNSLAA
jgi:hypothetical protein